MMIENIDPATLRKWQEADKAVIVDVREPAEYDAEHIEGAALVPLGRLRRAALPEHSGRKLVVMCRMGGRGQAACQRLRAEMSAHETIYHLEGGLLAWKEAGFPVARKDRPVAPAKSAPSPGSSKWRGLFRRLFAKHA
jgi:rhodanese-related sulfurtransferase